MFTSLEPWESHTSGIFVEASSHRHDRLLTHFSAPRLSPADAKSSCKFQASKHGLVFLVTTFHPGACIRHSCPSGNNKSFRSSVSGTGVEDKILLGAGGKDISILCYFTKTNVLETVNHPNLSLMIVNSRLQRIPKEFN